MRREGDSYAIQSGKTSTEKSGGIDALRAAAGGAYIRQAGANAYLAEQERAWLEKHGPIRVGYQDDYLAFCATDPETGELTGVLKDYLASASRRMVNAELKFEAVAYANIDADLTALNRGEVDCVFPADGTGVRVAVNEGNANYDCFPETAFPAWKPVYFPTTKDCLHIDDYKALFERLQSSLDALSPHATIPLRMGVMLWKQGVEPQELFDHARVACNMAQGYIFSRPLSAQDFEETYFVRAVSK